MEPAPEWRDELAERLGARVEALKALAGGASKEAWAVDAEGERLVVRRDAGGAIHEGTLSLRHEFELNAVDEPHPAVEYGLWWLRERRPEPLPPVVAHGDFRIGNTIVGPEGVRALLDWEFAHVSDPREDLAWPLVRAWRFGEDEK